MDAWKKATGADGKIEFLADGNGDFAKAIDLTFDGSGNGLGMRSKRYSMLVDDGVVKTLNIEDAPGKCDVSGGRRAAEAALSFVVRRGDPRPCSGSIRARMPGRVTHFVFIAPIAPARAATMPARASSSARSFMVVAGMALHPVPVHLVMRRAPHRAAATDRRSSPASCRRCASRSSSSRGSSSVMPFAHDTALSVWRSTVHGRFSASSAAIAAINSMRLLVVCGSPPLSSFSWSPNVQDRAPAARPRIARAGAVGVDR